MAVTHASRIAHNRPVIGLQNNASGSSVPGLGTSPQKTVRIVSGGFTTATSLI
jgi:hypothetical protein